MPTVSVIIPAYNAAQSVARAIDSALAQSLSPAEIIVVDDGSKDDTAAVAASFPDPVRVLRKPNGGPASARNLGARCASGKWLAMLDADDAWAPRRLERQLRLDTGPDIGIVHGPATASLSNTPAEIRFGDLWEQNWIVNSSVLIRRRAFESLGGFNEDPRLISVEDYHLWLRLSAAGWRIVTCADPEAMTYYSRGIGISSNIRRFFAASLFNRECLGAELSLPATQTNRKRLEILEVAGAAALYERQMGLARHLLGRAFLMKPSPSKAVKFAAACAPSLLLNLRRRLIAGEEPSPVPDRDRSEARPDSGAIGGGPHSPRADLQLERPTLLTVIDAEEEFDWTVQPYQSSSVKSMRSQAVAQRIFARFGVVPTYAVDYVVASQPDGYLPLLSYVQDGSCDIGAQLHPWINPPLVEPLCEENTFPGNLPANLEGEKLARLTETILRNFDRQPILYRAGRYGTGPHTADHLVRLGYQVDCSVVPLFRWRLGPDYRQSPTDPYWFGPASALLEIPVTAGMTGLLSSIVRHHHHLIFSRSSEAARLPAILARSRMLDRIRLSPEGNSLEEAKRLTRTLIQRDGRRLFALSYHSPSLEPGNTPYVRSARDLKRFLYWIEAYLEFFFGEIGGIASTPGAICERARRRRGVEPADARQLPVGSAASFQPQ